MLVRFVIVLLAALPVWAGEVVVLASGFRMEADRVERAGGVVRLVIGEGAIELPAELVKRIETEPDAAEPPPRERRPESADVAALIEEAAERYGLPAGILHSVAAVESGYDPRAVSPKGAVGVMQLMPSTAAALGADPEDPAENIDAGARYLRDLLLKYDGGLYRALAAYNAGPGAVDRYRGVPPYRETLSYVEKVLERYRRLAGGKRRAGR